MADDPETLGEVGRQLAALRVETDRQFTSLRVDTDRRAVALNSRMDKLVTAEVFQMHINHVDKQISDMTRGLMEETRLRREADGHEANERKSAAQAVRSWVFGLVFAIVTIAGGLITTWVANAGG